MMLSWAEICVTLGTVCSVFACYLIIVARSDPVEDCVGISYLF